MVQCLADRIDSHFGIAGFGGLPHKALQIRGTVEIEQIDGIVLEYEMCAKRYLGDKRGQAWIDQLRSAFPPMARIRYSTETGEFVGFSAIVSAAHCDCDGD